MKDITAMLSDYVEDHLTHFDCYPVDCEIDGILYDFVTCQSAYEQIHGDLFEIF